MVDQPSKYADSRDVLRSPEIGERGPKIEKARESGPPASRTEKDHCP
jgi:hypothetical protein